MSATKLGDGVAYFDTWQNASGVNMKTAIGFASAKYVATSDAYTSVASGGTYVPPVSLTYTPKFANSIISVHAVAGIRIIAGAGCTMLIRRDGNVVADSGSWNSVDMYYKGDNINHHTNLRGTVNVTAGSTAATTFTMRLDYNWGDGEYSHGWGDTSIYVIEYAQ